MRRRLVGLMVLAVLAAGCSAGSRPVASGPPAVDERVDVWFAQHMVPHLLQDTSIAYLTRDRLTDPALASLAGTIHRRYQARATWLVQWLAERGLAPHGHSHQRGDTLRQGDLERLSQLEGPALAAAFAEVMTARNRAGGALATTEARDGAVPELRAVARQLLAEQRVPVLRKGVERAARWRTTSTTQAMAGMATMPPSSGTGSGSAWL